MTKQTWHIYFQNSFLTGKNELSKTTQKVAPGPQQVLATNSLGPQHPLCQVIKIVTTKKKERKDMYVCMYIYAYMYTYV